MSNYGFGRFHTITAIDLVGRKQEKVIDLDSRCAGRTDWHLWMARCGSPQEANKCIGSYDPQMGKVDWDPWDGARIARTCFTYSPGGNRIVTTNVNAGTVSILDFVEAKGGPPGGPGGPAGGPPPTGFPAIRN